MVQYGSADLCLFSDAYKNGCPICKPICHIFWIGLANGLQTATLTHWDWHQGILSVADTVQIRKCALVCTRHLDDDAWHQATNTFAGRTAVT